MENYMNKLVSVIIPVYKVEKYLSRCVDSVLKQSYNTLEIILVDDGSPDGCPKLCDTYSAKDNRVKTIHKENGGLASARNAGIEVCTGDYIFFIDSDDWLSDENVLFDFVNLAEKNNADFVYGLMNTATDMKVIEQKFNNHFFNQRLFFLSNPYLFSAWNKLYKRSLLQYLHFAPGRVNEDVDIIPLVFCKAEEVLMLNRPTYNYYQNYDSITRKAFSEKRFDMFKSVAHAYKSFLGTNQEKSVFCENIFGFQLFSVYIAILKNTRGNERKRFLLQFCSLLRDNKFNDFFRWAFLCFFHNESITKRIKKLAALFFLRVFYFANNLDYKIDIWGQND